MASGQVTTASSTADPVPGVHRASGLGLSLAALGIVFGDIGTSPLYTFKTILDSTGATADRAQVLGSLSLVVWTLIAITTVKYVCIAMQVDNDGEGGILALMSLLGLKKKQRAGVVALGLFGAALIYGDGAITPAISVLSAVEGLKLASPGFAHYVLPLAVAILIGLFALQPLGTARIGAAFGPVMFLWFAVIAALGVWGVAKHPGVVAALNPALGVAYLVSGGMKGFLILGGVFLCVTGAEALYADMGHFGRTPIRAAWLVMVFPALLLNYAGQAALVLDGTAPGENIFYQLCPPSVLIPLIVLATIATVIASQAIITGAFSMTRQAIQLGWLPRLAIKQTSAEGYGQIYVGTVNWLLMIVTLGLTLGFGNSENLASAYGIAVSLTMLVTTFLLFVAMREVWNWPIAGAGAVAFVLMTIDGAFFVANLAKVAHGGYVPLLLAAAVYTMMWVWHRGAEAISARIHESLMPVDTFLREIDEKKVPRVPGAAVFLTRTTRDTPPVLVWHVRHNRALHEQIYVVTVVILQTPWSNPADRVTVIELAPHFWRAVAKFGFLERPDIPELLRVSNALGCTIKLDDVTYYVGHESVVQREDRKGLHTWQWLLFSLMEHNAVHVSDFFKLPGDSVVEIGRQISI